MRRALKIDSIVFDFDGTLAELRLDFAEMKKRLSALADSYRETVRPSPSLPVLEWLDWLEEEIRTWNGAHASEFREKAHALIRDIEIESAREGALFSFTRPMLAGLMRTGIKTAIITRNCDAAVRQ